MSCKCLSVSVAGTLAALCMIWLVIGSGCGGLPEGGSSIETPQAKSISAAEAQTLIQSRQGDPTFVIIDVRTAAEFAAGHIGGATNIPISVTDTTDFRNGVAGLDKSRTYFVYCGSQHRSPTAIAAMLDEGFTDLYELTGGLAAWQDAGLPVVN